MSELEQLQGEVATIRKELNALKEQVEAVSNEQATKEDIQELKKFMKALNVTVGVFDFSWNNASKIGSFVLLIAGFYMFAKAGVGSFVDWISNNTP